MTKEEREYIAHLIGGVRDEVRKLQKDITKLNECHVQLRLQRRKLNRLLAAADRNGLDLDRPQGRPRKDKGRHYAT